MKLFKLKIGLFPTFGKVIQASDYKSADTFAKTIVREVCNSDNIEGVQYELWEVDPKTGREPGLEEDNEE